MSNEKEIINRNSRENSSDVVDKILKDVTRLYDEYAVMSLRRKIAIDAILCDQRSSDCNCVYFLKNKENGLVKIGSTKIFPKREKTNIIDLQELWWKSRHSGTNAYYQNRWDRAKKCGI